MLVSAILPTRGRQEWARQAVKCFQAQTYPDKELVIVDDKDEPSFPEGPPILNSIHAFSSARNIGAKRNECCRIAKGASITHWDSDDWSAPERMAEQVQQLKDSGMQLVGYYSMLFHVDHHDEAERYYRYNFSPHWALGTSLTFWKSFWLNNKFPENKPKNAGEDSDMVCAARWIKQFQSYDGGQMMVARVHPGNTASKTISAPQYRKVTRADFPEAFFQ